MPYIKLDLLRDAEIFYDEENYKKVVALLETIDKSILFQKEKLELLNQQRKALHHYLLTGIVRVK